MHDDQVVRLERQADAFAQVAVERVIVDRPVINDRQFVRAGRMGVAVLFEDQARVELRLDRRVHAPEPVKHHFHAMSRGLFLENEVEVVMMPRHAVEAGIEDDKFHQVSRKGQRRWIASRWLKSVERGRYSDEVDQVDLLQGRRDLVRRLKLGLDQLELRYGFRHIDILDIADASLQRDRGFIVLGIQRFHPGGGGAEDTDMIVDILGGAYRGRGAWCSATIENR